MELEDFIVRIVGYENLKPNELVDHISFFILEYKKFDVVTVKDINSLYDQLKIKTHSRLAQYLSEEAKKKNGKYLKQAKGYVLERSILIRLRSAIEKSPRRTQIDQQLKDLVPKLSDTQERDFLLETINCLSVGANRAAIVMMWILTMDHLQKYIFNDSSLLMRFNSVLLKKNGIKIKTITDYHTFSQIKESDIIEIAKSAGIIGGDVRKILDEKLGIRNSAGHPSSIIVHESKVNEFIYDLTNNVLLKY